MEFFDRSVYEIFAENVIRESRYRYPKEHEAFLKAAQETAKERQMILPKGSALFRAQIGFRKKYKPFPYTVSRPLKSDRMKPLSNWAKEGRVNPKGIPCLYFSRRT